MLKNPALLQDICTVAVLLQASEEKKSPLIYLCIDHHNNHNQQLQLV